jgi:hypothetical protein
VHLLPTPHQQKDALEESFALLMLQWKILLMIIWKLMDDVVSLLLMF